MQSSQKASWQAPAKKRSQLKFARALRRTLIVLSLIGLTVLLAWFLFPPFFAPKTKIVLIGSEQHDSFNAPPIAFVAEDLDALSSLPSTTSTDSSDIWDSARSAKQLSDRIAEFSNASSDRLIIYLSAHGVSQAGEGYLLCDNFDLRRPDSGRISVGDFVSQLTACNASTKLVLLNAGSLDYDPRLGILANDFPRLLQRAVNESGDPSLFVFCSHAPLQTSHVSRGARRSVFGMFAGAGLEGWADVDGNQKLKLSELVAFTRANVSRWVTQNSDRTAVQTPQLYWGGGKILRKDPELLVLGDRDPTSLTAAKLVNADRGLGAADAALAGSGQAQGVIRRRQITLASNSVSEKTDAKSTSGNGDNSGPAENETDSASVDSAEGTSDGDGEAAKTGKGSGKDQKPASADAKTVRARQLLTGAWQQRDRSAESWSAVLPQASVLENQPHLWRELQAELLDFEERVRGGMAVDTQAVESILERTLPSNAKTEKKETSENDGGKGPPKVSAIETLFAEIDNPPDEGKRAIVVDHAHSLALAEIVAAETGRSLNIDIKGLLSALSKGTGKELDEWLKANWRDELSGYYELGYLKRLTEDEQIGWELVQTAAGTCLLGERVAALDLQSSGWVRSDVRQADQMRFFAEQLVFDRVGIQWQNRAKTLFETAGSQYRDAESKFIEVRKCQWLFEVLMSRSPSYLKWHQMTSQVAASRKSRSTEIAQLFRLMTEMAAGLDQPDAADVDSLTALREDLVAMQATIETACGNVSADRLVQNPPSPGDAYLADRLLSTPLLGSKRRGVLIESLSLMDQQLASEGDLAKVTRRSAAEAYAKESEDDPSSENWLSLIRQAELETEFVRLSTVFQESGTPAAIPNSASAVADALTALREAYQTWESTDERNETAHELLWVANSTFGSALQSFYRSASLAPESSNPCQGWAAVRGAVRLLQMTDARDVWRLAGIDTKGITEAIRVQSTLLWQAERLEQAAGYRNGSDPSALADVAESYRVESRLICARLAVQPSQLELSVGGPASLDLRYLQDDLAVVELRNGGEQHRVVRLSLDYEPDLLDVTLAQPDGTSPSDRNVIRLSSSARAMSKLSTLRSNPLPLAVGQTLKIALKIRRRDAASESTKLVADVYDADNESMAASVGTSLAPPQLLGRQRIAVQLPVAEVFSSSGDRTFLSSSDGLKLLPHPNRIEPYRFGVVNRSSRTKTISMAMFPIDSKRTPLSGNPDRWAESLAFARPMASFQIVAPGNGEPAFPAPPEDKKEEGEAGPGKEAATAEKKPEGDKEKKEEESKPILSTPMPEGMLIRLTDTETGEITYRTVEFAVQRPRRYVRPKVGYDASKKQIRIQVAARAPAQLPIGEPVKVACSLVGDRAGSTQGKLQGLLTRESPSATLFIKLDTPPPFTAQVHLTVDDYPRAFVFDVPCGKHVADVPEVTDLLDLRMATASNDGVVAAAETIPVALQVDAPVGTFEDGRDLLEIGVDLEKTGLPDPETSIVLNADRRVRVGLVKALPGGLIDFHTVVTDHVVDLPVDRLENLKLGVAALLTVSNETLSFPSIPLMIDTAAPVVGPVNRVDGMDFVKAGGEIPVSAWAWDEGAGVKAIEAAFDVDGSGEFPEGGAVFKGIRKTKREWVLVAQAGAEPGPQTLLVRGIDVVGNASDPIPLQVQVVSTETNDKLIEQQTVDVAGTITLRENTVAEAEIKLIASPEEGAAPESEAAPPAVEVRSAENGRYVIPDVSPGSYTLAIRAVVRNKPHLSEQPVVVTPGPKRTMNVDVKLR